MSEGLAEAVAAIETKFDPSEAARVRDTLAPVLAFEPVSAQGRPPGATHLAGVPDVPQGFIWPRPPMLADPNTIAERANATTAQELLEHLRKGLPYAFVAQVDLGEAVQFGKVAADLPSEGRLLFFYDLLIGPWDTGKRSARVIWDATPAQDLSPAIVPDDLARADEAERQWWLTRRASQSEVGTNYFAARRDLGLRLTWRLPDREAIEAKALPELDHESSLPNAEAFRQAYDEVLETHYEVVPGEGWKRHQLLGSPRPEQNDPRIDAAIVSIFGLQSLPRERLKDGYPRMLAEAAGWKLLLQLDIADWLQDKIAEGTVYFLIRDQDLRERRFDEVIAVYQQT